MGGSRWVREDVTIDSHPDVIAAGFWGQTVFETILRIDGNFGFEGRIKEKYVTPEYLCIVRHCEYRKEFKQGIEACLREGLLEFAEGVFFIPSWDNYQSPDMVRKRKERMDASGQSGTKSDKSGRVRTQPESPATKQHETGQHGTGRDEQDPHPPTPAPAGKNVVLGAVASPNALDPDDSGFDDSPSEDPQPRASRIIVPGDLVSGNAEGKPVEVSSGNPKGNGEVKGKPAKSSTWPDLFPHRAAVAAFEYWVRKFGKHSRSTFTPDRERCIHARAKEGMTMKEARLAIDGCYDDEAWPDRKEKPSAHDFKLIFRNRSNVERFVEMELTHLRTEGRDVDLSDDGQALVPVEGGE